jgi:hypothetical protein
MPIIFKGGSLLHADSQLLLESTLNILNIIHW